MKLKRVFKWAAGALLLALVLWVFVLAGIASAGAHQGQMWWIARMFGVNFLSRFTEQKLERYTTTNNQGNLKFLSDLMAQGKVTPFLEKAYRSSETAQALRCFGEGHARGKIAITID